MKRFKLSALAALTAITLAICSYAYAEVARGNEAEAKAMVKRAIDYMKANGEEKTLAEISNPDGKFISKDLYVFVYDTDGKVVAHGQNQKLVGKHMIDAKDPDGKEYVKERVAIVKAKGSGWQEYKFRDPISKNIEDKKAYVELYGKYIFGCGVYKQ